MTGSVIVAGARTPMGRLLGNLKDFPATRLGGAAIAAALQRSGVAPEQVQYVIMGQVLQAGAGQIPARQAAVVAGGMESMTNAPHLLTGQRQGYKYGDVIVKDHMAIDGLTDAWDCCSMGESTERHGTKLGISRREQDEFAAASHQRAAAAQ